MIARLLQRDPTAREAQWIVPTPLCRDRTVRELTLGPSQPARGASPRVRCWADLWRWVASLVRKGPTLLSDSSARAVFEQALNDQIGPGRRSPLAGPSMSPGYRRRLRRRFGEWTTDERHRDKDWADAPGDDADEVLATAERLAFRRYRRLLADLDAEDEAGLSVWASLRLRDRADRAPAGDRLVFLDFEGRTPAQWRILRDALERPRPVDVTLCFDGPPERADLFLATADVRSRLLELGMTESTVPTSPHRPAGLRAVDALLFHAAAPRIETGDGLTIRGGPLGMDLGRMVTREVADLLGRGVDPDEVLVAFPLWDDQAEAACESLRGAGVVVHDASPKSLDRDPAVAAALQAARLPVEDWETDRVVRLLRNGQLHPDWEEAREPLALAEAASTLHDLPVFRGRSQILDAVAREIGRSEDAAEVVERERRRKKVERARRALPILERLIGAIDTLNLPRTWSEHVFGFRRAVDSLGIGRAGRDALETLHDALDDRAETIERLPGGRRPVTWREFVIELEELAAEACQPEAPAPPGAVRTALVDDLAGCRAGHVIVAGLVEGSFPRRPAVRRFLELKPGETPGLDARRAYAAEALRFARALGAADEGLHLFYPTTDAKGQPLLRAGFLDDLLGSLTPAAEGTCHRAHARFHPALLDHPDLAVSPADARVAAAAFAAEHGRIAALRDLARSPLHRGPLEGAAAALAALEHRRRGVPFGPFEGLLQDPEALARIAEKFSPSNHTFSPSQLETYLICPFQFFSRHVLHLEPIAERDELNEDYTERGSRLHDILEEFERRRAEADPSVPDDAILAAALDKTLAREIHDLSELDLGLREIEHGQIERIIAQYAHQRAEYALKSPSGVAPRWFEFGFGEAGMDHPLFELSLGDEVVKLKGRIDRIDVEETPGGLRFRVIDYKSGTPPADKDVRDYRMVQLPLYAMAVERLLYETGNAELLDVGYWGLKDKGYRPIAFEVWRGVREGLVARVFDIIGRLRAGTFPVAPHKDGCETYCEYRSVCRIRQVRAADKVMVIAEAPSAEKTLAGRPTKRARPAATNEEARP